MTSSAIFASIFDREFKHARSVHFDVGRTANLPVGDLTGYVEQVEIIAVGFEFAVDDARFVGRAQHYCACAVAEQNAGLRSFQSTMRLNVSAPMTKAFFQPLSRF